MISDVVRTPGAHNSQTFFLDVWRYQQQLHIGHSIDLERALKASKVFGSSNAISFASHELRYWCLLQFGIHTNACVDRMLLGTCTCPIDQMHGHNARLICVVWILYRMTLPRRLSHFLLMLSYCKWLVGLLGEIRIRNCARPDDKLDGKIKVLEWKLREVASYHLTFEHLWGLFIYNFRGWTSADTRTFPSTPRSHIFFRIHNVY